MLGRIESTTIKGVALTIVMGLSGCSAMPPLFSPPQLNAEIPAQWLANYRNDNAQANPAWWTTFNDSGLNAVIAEVISHNHDLQAAAARIDTAEAEARIAGVTLYPQVQTGLDAARAKQVLGSSSAPGAGLSAAGSPVSFTSNSYGVSLAISWELDVWGRIRSGVAAAIGNLQAQQADFQAAALSLTAQTAKAWFAVTEAQLQLTLANETVESFRKTARQAANRVDAGVQSPTDKHLTAANLASAETLAQQRTETLKRSLRQLEVLLGRYPAGQIDNVKVLPDVPPIPETGLPSELLSRRPDLIAAERRYAASVKRVDAAKAELLPRLSLTGSVGTSGSEIRNLLDGNYLMWTIAGNLVQPIFQGGRLIAQVDATHGREKEATQRYAQLALNAFAEVETVLAVDDNLRQREDAQQRTAKAAQQASLVAENRYGQGVDTLLAVLEGQRRSLDARSAVISAHRQRLVNRIDLYLALGGGFNVLQAPTASSTEP